MSQAAKGFVSVPARRIAGLDGLRAIAALMVFMEHRTAATALHLGGYGVRLFFALSGYLIIGTIIRSFGEYNASAGSKVILIKRFFVSRAFRILPIYWLTLGFASLLLILEMTNSVSWAEIQWHLIFAGNIYASDIAGHWSKALSHFWSLAVEEQFYIFIAPILILLGRRWIFLACVVTICAAVVRYFYLLNADAPSIKIGTDSIIGFGMIALGGCLHFVPIQNNEGARRNLADKLLLFYIVSPVLVTSYFGGLEFIESLTIFIAAALILTIESQPHSYAVLVLEWRPLAYLGSISYGFYVYHYWMTAETLATATFGIVDIRSTLPITQVAVLFLVVLMMAMISSFLVEKPLLALRQRLRMRSGPAQFYRALHT